MIRRNAVLAAVVLIFAAQAIASHFLRRAPFLPSPPPLANLSLQPGGWQPLAEETVAPETLAMLGPDDFLARQYEEPGTTDQAELFIAYYKTQLGAKNAHDPKVCLPGAGWNPIESRLARVTIPASGFSFPVNYYRIKREGREQVVVYWFQTLRGVYTFEQQLRVHKVLDAILDNRTDMALVRIIVPVTENDASNGVAAADRDALGFAQSVYTSMLPYFRPSDRPLDRLLDRQLEKSGS
jgi:EpsI family protein